MMCQPLGSGGNLGESHDAGRERVGGHSTMVMTAFSTSSEYLSSILGGPGLGGHSRTCTFGSEGGSLSWPCDTAVIVRSEGTQASREEEVGPTHLRADTNCPAWKGPRSMPH